MGTRVLLTALTVASCLSNAFARTWYVAADGSGDAQTIAAAVDSSVSGDVILVGPGTHFVSEIDGGGIRLKAGTSLLSEAGPTTTILKPGNPPAQPGLVSTRDNCVVSGFSLLGFGVVGATSPVEIAGDFVEVCSNIIHAAGGGSAIRVAGDFASIHHNVCLSDGGLGIYVFSGGAEIRNNIILAGLGSSIDCLFLSVLVHCNLINGPTGGCIQFDNFSGDPMFCAEGDYGLQSDSPCAPGNHPGGIDCGLIGPLPVGCGPVSVETRTWGSIKAMYR